MALQARRGRLDRQALQALQGPMGSWDPLGPRGLQEPTGLWDRRDRWDPRVREVKLVYKELQVPPAHRVPLVRQAPPAPQDPQARQVLQDLQDLTVRWGQQVPRE